MPLKQENIRKLYLTKKQVKDNPKAVELINSVLLSENGAKAVLYPYNDQVELILSKWAEAKSPEKIAEQLNIDEEVVLCVIEDPKNYKEV